MQPCILAAGGTRHQLAAPPWAAEAQPLPPPAGPCPSQQTPPSAALNQAKQRRKRMEMHRSGITRIHEPTSLYGSTPMYMYSTALLLLAPKSWLHTHR